LRHHRADPALLSRPAGPAGLAAPDRRVRESGPAGFDFRGPPSGTGAGEAGEREGGFGLGVAGDDGGDVLAERRTELEAVPRAAVHEPETRGAGQPPEDQVAVRRVLVLADSRFDERCRRVLGESAGEEAPGALERLARRRALERGRIDRLAARVVGDLETA